MNYYNEFDPYAAQWLRNLIEAGHIPQGEVDTRSIKDVRASDLTGFVQCHFFAGLGGWSHALRLAGWPEDRPVWTGSCPCQPFSAAGAQKGTADDRHLWPTWFNLIRQCRPPVVFGEQVESAINHGWLDLVQSDLESESYACGAVGIPAGGVGAPHIRQRLWFVADAQHDGGRANEQGRQAQGRTVDGRSSGLADTQHAERGAERQIDTDAHGRDGLGRGGDVSELADANSGRHDGRATATRRQAGASTGIASGSASDQLAGAGWQRVVFSAECDEDGYCPICKDIDFADCSCPGPTQDEYEYEERFDGLFARRMADSQCEGLEGYDGDGNDRDEPGRVNAQQAGSVTPSSWSDCDWLPCRDGKARPVEPGTFPLAHGVSGRVGRLRAYGNAIVPQVAQAFIEAYLES